MARRTQNAKAMKHPKIHLLIGSRTACDDILHVGALFTINPQMVDCKLCRRTKLFNSAIRRQRLEQRCARGKTAQMELFTFKEWRR